MAKVLQEMAWKREAISFLSEVSLDDDVIDLTSMKTAKEGREGGGKKEGPFAGRVWEKKERLSFLWASRVRRGKIGLAPRRKGKKGEGEGGSFFALTSLQAVQRTPDVSTLIGYIISVF